MNSWLIPSLILLFAWRIFNLQDASAAVRDVRALKDSSKLISHVSGQADTVTQGPSNAHLSLNRTLNFTDESLVVEQARARRHDDGFEEASAETVADDLYSEEFINCSDAHTAVEKGNFNKSADGSVYVPVYGRHFTPKNYVETMKGDIIVCSKFLDEDGDYPTSNFDDLYSEEFINCSDAHTAVEKGNFNKSADGSVYVPVYGRHFTPKNYVETMEGDIIVCSEFLDEDGDYPTSNFDDLYSEEFINCSDAHTTVEKGNFNMSADGSVYVPVYGRHFTPKNYVETMEGDIIVCSRFFDEANGTRPPKFDEALGKVTLAGTAVSSLCIVLHIVMFLLLEKLRNLPGYSLFSMCIALLIAYICTFADLAREESSDCTALGIIKAYGFLASFFWMNAMSFDIWRSLRLATAKLRLTSQRPMMARFAIYSAYSWGCPLLIIIIGFIVNSIDGIPELYRLVISDEICWFRHKPALQVYFAFPLFTLLVLNILLFVSSFFMISSATMSTAENRVDLWSRFLVSVRLAVVMGLMWIFGVLATALEAEWLWYFYVICNVLQGVFIFFSFTLTEKTRKEWRKTIASKKSSVFRTLTTLQSSSSV